MCWSPLASWCLPWASCCSSSWTVLLRLPVSSPLHWLYGCRFEHLCGFFHCSFVVNSSPKRHQMDISVMAVRGMQSWHRGCLLPCFADRAADAGPCAWLVCLRCDCVCLLAVCRCAEGRLVARRRIPSNSKQKQSCRSVFISTGAALPIKACALESFLLALAFSCVTSAWWVLTGFIVCGCSGVQCPERGQGALLRLDC